MCNDLYASSDPFFSAVSLYIENTLSATSLDLIFFILNKSVLVILLPVFAFILAVL